MAPSPQSRFIEGSMNDRTSNAPPPGYLGPDAEGTSEYERHFALDWKPPELHLQRPANRSSFISIGSATSPTSMRSAKTWSRGHKSAGSSASGFLAPLWGGVKEKLSLHRSKSSNTITSENSGSDDGSNEILVPPTFKHKRSESTNTAIFFRSKDSSRQRDASSPSRGSETPKLKKAPSAATLPTLSTGGVNSPSGFDPTKRPTREEIQTSYQSLLASGFFGNRAIQSTRFSRPGQNESRSDLTPCPSIEHRISEDGKEQHQHQQQQQQQHESPPPPPPPPQRQPPPPPPTRTAPRPPGLSMDITPTPSSSAGIPVSETVVFSPVPQEPLALRDMPSPPSPPKQKKPGHKPSLSFSALYSSTRPANEPSVSRPSRSIPLSPARFSLDSGPRSFDAQRTKDPNQQRGVKRPFMATNSSDLSLGSKLYYDIGNGNGNGNGNGSGSGSGSGMESEKSITTAEGGRRSGARKLVKKLRKSASRLSMDLGRTISRPASTLGGESDVKGSGWLSPPRQPLSSAFRRSFSWRPGKSGPEATAAEPNGNHDSRNSSHNRNGNGTVIGGNGTIGAAPQVKTPGRFLPPSLSVIKGSPTSPERNKLKKKEIRGRRLRRQNSIKFPSKATHQPSVPAPTNDRDATTENTMDWQSSPTRPSPSAGGNQSRSRSRSRPRRSSTTMFMHSQSRPGTAHSTESGLSSTSNANYNHQQPHHHVASASPFDSSAQPRRSAEANNAVPAGADCMEGVEFMGSSFHLAGRVRPGVPLAVVPDANRGIPSVPSIPGEYRDVKAANGRGENVDGGGGAWSSPRALF